MSPRFDDGVENGGNQFWRSEARSSAAEVDRRDVPHRRAVQLSAQILQEGNSRWEKGRGSGERKCGERVLGKREWKEQIWGRESVWQERESGEKEEVWGERGVNESGERGTHLPLTLAHKRARVHTHEPALRVVQTRHPKQSWKRLCIC